MALYRSAVFVDGLAGLCCSRVPVRFVCWYGDESAAPPLVLAWFLPSCLCVAWFEHDVWFESCWVDVCVLADWVWWGSVLRFGVRRRWFEMVTVCDCRLLLIFGLYVFYDEDWPWNCVLICRLMVFETAGWWFAKLCRLQCWIVRWKFGLCDVRFFVNFWPLGNLFCVEIGLPSDEYAASFYSTSVGN